jgi:hypothetical protein
MMQEPAGFARQPRRSQTDAGRVLWFRRRSNDVSQNLNGVLEETLSTAKQH